MAYSCLVFRIASSGNYARIGNSVNICKHQILQLDLIRAKNNEIPTEIKANRQMR